MNSYRIHNIKEYKDYLALLENLTISHIKGYQYDIKDSTDLSVPESTNIETEKFATRYARHPIHSHLLSAPFSIYINTT